MNTILLKRLGLAAALYMGGQLSINAAEDALRIEVEDGDYQATLVNNANFSGGKGLNFGDATDYVNLTFNVPSAGYYNVLIGGVNLYGDGKVVNVSVNGSVSSVAINGTEEISAGSFELPAGEVVVKVTPNWTWSVVDYVRLQGDEAVTKPFTLDAPVTPNVTGGAQAIYNVLAKNFGVKTISGAMLGNMDNTDGKDVTAHEDITIIKELSGKNPALIGVDFMNATGQSAYANNNYFTTYTKRSMSLMKDLWAKGGIPKFTWHWRDPSLETDAFYAYSASSHPEGTNFNFTDAMNADGTWDTSSDTYKSMIKDIDVIADYFLELKEAGVSGIFRPLHEASGGWFWWGTQGGENYAKLYRLIYDEMVKVKGVNNLLWVWNPNSTGDVDWNPGDEYYDVVSVDIYTYDSNGPVYHVYDSQSAAFLKLKTMTDSKKLIALTECGSVPDVELCYGETVPASWSWWMPWYESWDGKWVSKGTDKDMWTKVMNDERIITLEDMPGWANESAPKVGSANDVEVYPTKVSNYFIVTADDAQVVVNDASGRVLTSQKVNGKAVISTLDWKNGLYFVNVNSSMGNTTYKLVK